MERKLNKKPKLNENRGKFGENRGKFIQKLK